MHVRFVVTADSHLSAYSQRLTPSKLLERRARLRAAFTKTVDIALERQADAFIQAGDLFDNLEPLNADRALVAEQFKRLHDAGVVGVAVSGNHDTRRLKAQGGTSPLLVYREAGLLRYLSDQTVLRPQLIEKHGERIAIAGLSSDPTAVPGTDPLDELMIDDPEDVLARATAAILILHAQIEGFGYPSPEERIVRHASIAALTGFNVVVAGHIHGFSQTTVEDKTVVLCGATERMDFASLQDQTGCVCLNVSPSGVVQVEHIAIPAQPRCVLTINTRELFPQQATAEATPRDEGEEDANGEDEEGTGSTDQEALQAVVAPVEETMGASTPVDQHLDDESEGPGDEVMAVSVQGAILARVRDVCAPDVMVRLEIEGPLTLEQRHALDLRAIWLFGQQHAFSFELDESGLTLAGTAGQAPAISKGQRVSPRATLLAVVAERMAGADAGERALLARVQAGLMEAFDGTGVEAAI